MTKRHRQNQVKEKQNQLKTTAQREKRGSQQ